MKEGEIMKVDISEKMNDHVGSSHWLYQATQKEIKENQISFEKKCLERKKLNNEINFLKGAKKVALDYTKNKVT